MQLIALVGMFFIMLCAGPAFAVTLGDADRTWIRDCVEQRAKSDLHGLTAKRYCRCMQQIVEANERFDTITALERTYPPAHRMCLRQAQDARR
ncbi:hypothetical protein OCOJLMKI_1150 [Methylobacterium iners]|uniref:Uncharacterized protein n=1 Tax=Methylobacterium iners TaxID=418707 RepID=A0ABQ4RUS6_9HYPH|nr:hypothetical protein OCOJLMKI_1150 [Methylobacterium iners]